MTTDPQDELLTQVDVNNKVIGGITRGEAHSLKGIYYRTVFVLVRNNDDKILIQKRSATKDLYPNCWDLSVGGHVAYGDSYEITALRELKEELGINARLGDLVDMGEVLVVLPISNEYFRVFEYRLKKSDSINLALGEVSEIKWMRMREIKESMKDKTMSWYPRPTQTIETLY